MRADSGIIYFNDLNVLIYLFVSGNDSIKPQIVRDFKICYKIRDGINDNKLDLILIENIIDIVSSQEATGIYKWKIFFKNTKPLLLNEISKVLDFGYEVLNPEDEQILICKGIIFDFA